MSERRTAMDIAEHALRILEHGAEMPIETK
jgi:hypothetical protein